MDRALKERIIGAAVLVVFVVLVVPVFLDGPPESGDNAHGGAGARQG
jgi:cell division septation protein DedD